MINWLGKKIKDTLLCKWLRILFKIWIKEYRMCLSIKPKNMNNTIILIFYVYDLILLTKHWYKNEKNV